MIAGYMHPGYAESLAEYGTPRHLPRAKGWILERKIAGFPYLDAMGCYPLFACQDWSQLNADLEAIGDELVSLSLVTDPFGQYDEIYLKQCFSDIVIPFKQHFIVDLNLSLETFVSKHHRRYAHRALQALNVERCNQPLHFLDDWVELYANLVERHNIKGITSFSRSSFAKQLTVPGVVAFRAVCNRATVGMLLWYVYDQVGYYHLGAFNTLGYDLRASFALFWFAIEYFTTRGLQWLNLGAGAGVKSDDKDGLSRFKRGWATGIQTAYFCGRIFDRARYLEITRAKGVTVKDYFPAYRKGEFT
jgi:hypothetical protein